MFTLFLERSIKTATAAVAVVVEEQALRKREGISVLSH